MKKLLANKYHATKFREERMAWSKMVRWVFSAWMSPTEINIMSRENIDVNTSDSDTFFEINLNVV